MEQTVQQERRIHVIPATKQATAPGQSSGRRQRVAAYCRVSTDSEEQLTSYTAQKAYYTQKIGENPGRYFCGQRYNRHKHEEAGGVQKDDRRLQTG